MALDRAFVNVLLLGLAFMLVFTAFQTWGNIQGTIISSIKKDDANFSGANAYYSLGIIYFCMALFNWAAPSLISVVGSKFSMLFGGITYVLFIMSFSIPHTWLLYLASCVIGVGAASIWTGQGNYLTLNSSEDTISRNSGVFWALLQMSMFIGNTFVYFAFQGKEEIDSGTRQIVIWTLSAIAGVGLAVMVFFPKPPRRVTGLSDKSDPKAVEAQESSSADPVTVTNNAENIVNAFKGAIRLFLTRNMLLLSITFVYTGLELGFWSGVYGTCISYTENLPNRKELVGISGIFIGLGEVIAGALFGILGKRTTKWGRDPIVILGFVLHAISFFVIFLNIPNYAPFNETSDKAFITSNAILAILGSFLLGFGDACYNTQVFSMLGDVYADDSAAAFAIFKFTQSVGAAVSFAYASSFVLYFQLGILLVFAILGTVTFVWVEWRHKTNAEEADTSTMSEFE